MNNPEKSVEIELNQIAINIVSKHLPTDPRRGLERSIAEALSAERKKVEEIAYAKGLLKYRVNKAQQIDVIRWIKWPSYDFIFGVPAKTNMFRKKEAAFFQYRDTRRRKVKCGFYVDRGELKELYHGFKDLWERNK